MDLPLPEGTAANFSAAPQVGELGVVAFARDIAAHLHRLGRTAAAAHYREDGPDQLTTRLSYQLTGHRVEVVVQHGDLALSVDGDPVELPYSPRDPAWAIAWKVHTHLDDLRRAMHSLSSGRPSPSDADGRQALPAAGPRLERARTAGVTVNEVAPRAGSSDPSTQSELAEDRTAAHEQITVPDAAREPVEFTLRRQATNMDADCSIAIVGGSITGPVLALLLRQAGFDNIHVYEATPSAVPQAGGVIWLDYTSLSVLDTIGVPQEEIVPFPSQRVVSVKIADRREVDLEQTWWPGRNTTWTLTHHALTQRLPADTLHKGARLVGLEPGDDGRAVLHFQGGEHATADLVVGTDGRKSTCRKLLDPARPLRYAGYVAHRGQLDGCPPDLRDMWRYQAERTQFNLFPIQQPDGGIGTDWTFYLNASAEQFRAHFGADPTTRTFVLSQQVSVHARAHVDAMAAELLTPTAADLVYRTTRRMAAPVVDIAPPTQMVHSIGSSRAVLLGDALAPVRPQLGRGANNGIDQAASLVTALAQYRDDGVDLDVTLSAWQARCLPVVTESLERGPEVGRELGLGL